MHVSRLPEVVKGCYSVIFSPLACSTSSLHLYICQPYGKLLHQPWQKVLCPWSLESWVGHTQYLWCSLCFKSKPVSLGGNISGAWQCHSTPSPLIGRTRIIAQATLTAIHTLYKQESDLYLNELVTFLAIEHSIIVSTSTLSQNLLEAGLTHKILHKLASECDEILWAELKQSIHENFIGNGSEFVCVDETSKNKLVYAWR